MNYLAHSWHLLDDPYEVAGAAVPDWLGLTRPRLRCRSRHARPFLHAEQPMLASVARGVVRHHADDDWFHQTAAFGETSLELARRIRRATGDVDGLRPGFLGHILLELLLDASLHAAEPARLDRYYAVLEEVDPREIAAAVGTISGVDAAPLAGIISRFLEMRFLYDYADDDRLFFRLSQVAVRAGLAPLPASLRQILPGGRELVAQARRQLLTPLAPLATVAAPAAEAGL